VKHLFGVLPDSYPFCQAYIHNEALVRIGKAKPIKVVPIPGEKDSRKKWIPIEKADELGVPATIPIKGYEIYCASCGKIFIGKEPFHQNFCSKCVGRKLPEIESKPDQKPKSAKSIPTKSKPKTEKIVPTDKPKPKRRGRPPKNKSEKKPSKRSKKSEKTTSSRPTRGRKGSARKQKK